MKPAVSVVIPVYNAAYFIKRAIDSVLYQTFSDYELLLLDDGSDDQSIEIIQSYSDPRIQCIQCSHDFIETVNKGYSMAKGKYIAQLDHDDLMVPRRLQIQYDFMESNPQIASCGGWMHCFGKRTHVIMLPLEHDQIILNMLLHGPILNPTGFVRIQFLIEHQIRHQSEYGFYADFKFWSDVSKKGKLANIPQILTLYRTSDDQASEKFQPEWRDSFNKIKYEMLEYILSHLIDDGHLAVKQLKQMMHVLMQMNEKNCFSTDTFFRFIYEIASGFYKKGLINFTSQSL